MCACFAGTVGEWAAARTSSRMSLDMAASGSSSDAGEASVVLYTRGEPSDTFTLILQGKALIRTGAPTAPAVCTFTQCVDLPSKHFSGRR